MPVFLDLLLSFLFIGLLPFIVFKQNAPRWALSLIALGYVLGRRLFVGEWHTTIGGGNSGTWYLEIICGIASWAFAALLLSLCYWAVCWIANKLKPKHSEAP